FANLARQFRGAEEVLDQELAFVPREGLEQHRRGVQFAAPPCGMKLDELRPSEARDHYWHVFRPLGDVVDEIEERRLRPLNVVEHDYYGTASRERFEQCADR